MGDDLSLPERGCARTPMQWSTEPHGGFTKNPKPHIPVISGGAYGYEHVNVAEQRRDTDSLMNWMERIIRMRKEVPEIGWGDFVVLRTAAGHSCASLRLAQQLGCHVYTISAPCLAKSRLDVGLEATNGQRLINLLSRSTAWPMNRASIAS